MPARLTEGIPPSHHRQRRRWLFCALIITVFIVILVLISEMAQLLTEPQTNMHAPSAQQPPEKQTALGDSLPTVNILVAARNIEASEIFEPNMLMGKNMNPEHVPKGAIWASEKAIVIGKAATKSLRANTPVTLDIMFDPYQAAALNSLEKKTSTARLPTFLDFQSQSLSAEQQKKPLARDPFPALQGELKPIPAKNPSSQGSLRMRDPKTGEYIEWELHGGRWESKR